MTDAKELIPRPVKYLAMALNAVGILAACLLIVGVSAEGANGETLLSSFSPVFRWLHEHLWVGIVALLVFAASAAVTIVSMRWARRR